MQVKIGDWVDVPNPNDSDIHSHAFTGHVICISKGHARIVDGEDNTFDIELERLQVHKD